MGLWGLILTIFWQINNSLFQSTKLVCPHQEYWHSGGSVVLTIILFMDDYTAKMCVNFVDLKMDGTENPLFSSFCIKATTNYSLLDTVLVIKNFIRINHSLLMECNYIYSLFLCWIFMSANYRKELILEMNLLRSRRLIYSMVYTVYPWPKTRQLPFAIAQTRAKILLAPFSWLENWDQNRKWAVNTRSEYQEKSHLGDTYYFYSHTYLEF